MVQEKEAVRNRILILTAASILMLAAYFIIINLDGGQGGFEDGHDHDHGIHGHYITYTDPAMITSVEFTPRGGESFTITRRDTGLYLADGGDTEEMSLTVSYAAALPFLTALGPPAAPLADYGLDPPVMSVVITAADGVYGLSIGDEALSGDSVYVLSGGVLYLADSELTWRLTLPERAYRVRKLWPGEPGDRPLLTKISVDRPWSSQSASGLTVIRNDLDDDAPIGLSRYQMVSPVEFICNDDLVRTKILNGVLSIDFDEIAEDDIEFGLSAVLSIEAEDFEVTLTVGGEAPGGGRYLMKDGIVYIDRLGDYGFLDVKPLDLTYGLAFWLYRFDDVKRITVTENGVVRTVPEDTSEINHRRFFAHVLNFSVVAEATVFEIDESNKVTLEMTDGSVRELIFTRQNERQLAVSIDGARPAFACNIRDRQLIIDGLDILDAGGSIREG